MVKLQHVGAPEERHPVNQNIHRPFLHQSLTNVCPMSEGGFSPDSMTTGIAATSKNPSVKIFFDSNIVAAEALGHRHADQKHTVNLCNQTLALPIMRFCNLETISG